MPTEAKMKRLAKSLKMMVARDGIEPPTPAFSGCDYSVFSTTYSGTSDSVSLCKYVEDEPILSRQLSRALPPLQRKQPVDFRLLFAYASLLAWTPTAKPARWSLLPASWRLSGYAASRSSPRPS